MRIHKFEGTTMRDAIAKVKAELGDQAVIISTRQIRRGLLGGTVLEISAAIDDDDKVAPAPTGPSMGLPTAPLAPPPPAQRPEDMEKLIGPLRSELRSLRALVRTADSNRSGTELRAELAALRKLVEDIKQAPAPAPVAARAPRREAPATAHDDNPDAPLVRASVGNTLVLVGPTGAGKTTTIAKLAARAALIDNKKVKLVTLDGLRVGGVDQIRTFADLIGVPLEVADSPAQLAEILEDDDSDLVLIDTAGRSPRDLAAVDELAAGLAALPSRIRVEVHVVVPAASSPAVVDELVGRYRKLAPARLLFTKLDEIERGGELARAPSRTNLPVTWVTTGQDVPEDIEEPTAIRLLELASGGLYRSSTSTSRSHQAA
jgi:flagellar biosynthesis protein FlhF